MTPRDYHREGEYNTLRRRFKENLMLGMEDARLALHIIDELRNSSAVSEQLRDQLRVAGQVSREKDAEIWRLRRLITSHMLSSHPIATNEDGVA